MCHAARDIRYEPADYTVNTLPSMATQRRYIEAMYPEDVVDWDLANEERKKLYERTIAIKEPSDLPFPAKWTTRYDNYVRARMATIHEDESRLVQTSTITTKSKLNRAIDIAGRSVIKGLKDFSSQQNQEDITDWKKKRGRWIRRARSVPNQLKTIELSVKLRRDHLMMKKEKALLLQLNQNDVKDES